ncbi:MAG: hypothetical protein ACOC46_03765 [Pirellulales bacterium]
MKSLVKQLKKLNDDELLGVSDAIDAELERRMEREESVPDSARRRAVQRQQSYRSRTGSSAPPVAATGLKPRREKRRAA